MLPEYGNIGENSSKGSKPQKIVNLQENLLADAAHDEVSEGWKVDGYEWMDSMIRKRKEEDEMMLTTRRSLIEKDRLRLGQMSERNESCHRIHLSLLLPWLQFLSVCFLLRLSGWKEISFFRKMRINRAFRQQRRDHSGTQISSRDVEKSFFFFTVSPSLLDWKMGRMHYLHHLYGDMLSLCGVVCKWEEKSKKSGWGRNKTHRQSPLIWRSLGQEGRHLSGPWWWWYQET